MNEWESTISLRGVMEDFGVRFRVDDAGHFDWLRALVHEIKTDKESGQFRADADWVKLIPDSVKSQFHWPSTEERQSWLAVRDSTPIAVEGASRQLSAIWNFFSVIEAFESGEYTILRCEMTDEKDIAEIHIDPWAYPYGGLGPIIALAEAFGCHVVGLNEYGKYLTYDDLVNGRD